MYKSIVAVVAAVALSLPSMASATWNANPMSASQLRVVNLNISQDPSYRVFVEFSGGSAYPWASTVCSTANGGVLRPTGAGSQWRVYGTNGDLESVRQMTSVLLAAQLSGRRVAVHLDGTCVGGWPTLLGVALLD